MTNVTFHINGHKIIRLGFGAEPLQACSSGRSRRCSTRARRAAWRSCRSGRSARRTPAVPPGSRPIPRSLGSAHAGGPARLAADPALCEVAQRHGATTAQIALAWLFHTREKILLIPGTSSVSHLEENVRAGIDLTDEDVAALDAV
jgi:aryl-alcohol dehydrogenase-like predicted oxidoreductase